VIESSLRRDLVIRLAGAIVILLVLDSIACYFTAAHFANLIYDRWLVDSARSLSKAIRIEGNRAVFALSNIALDVFQYDEVDRTYFRVTSKQTGYLGGDRILPEIPVAGAADPRIVTTDIKGQPVRLVITRIHFSDVDDSVTIEVAETLNKRGRLMTEIVLAMAAPQVALLIFALFLSWSGIALGLKPLTSLAAEIEARGHDNLAPVPEHGLPKEARTLVSRINDLLARLERMVSAQKRFVADAAHQLRTPLAAILLYASRAERAAVSEPEQLALSGLHAAAERAARLIQQLLALARAEPEANAALEFAMIDLNKLARSIGEEWVPRALAQDTDFGLIVPDHAAQVAGSAGMLGEMLSNLIDNALRYSGHGSRVTVTVAAGPPICICVEDDGPGVPFEEREKIFARFYRVSTTSSQGCGLGLSIVREIARLHEAEVSVAGGRDERGARFVVTFSGANSRLKNKT
jgi:two-component system sensor histidine kinase TctE